MHSVWPGRGHSRLAPPGAADRVGLRGQQCGTLLRWRGWRVEQERVIAFDDRHEPHRCVPDGDSKGPRYILDTGNLLAS